MSTASTDRIMELARQTLGNAKSGKEILSLIEDVVEERDELVKNHEHLKSLGRLAEKMVAEADDLAKQIKKEVEEKAQAGARAIVSRAEEQAGQIREDAAAKAACNAREETKRLQEQALGEMESAFEKQRNDLLDRMSEATEQLSRQIMDEAEDSTRRLKSILEDINRSVGGIQLHVRPAGNMPGVAEKALSSAAATDVEHEVRQEVTANEERPATKQEAVSGNPGGDSDLVRIDNPSAERQRLH